MQEPIAPPRRERRALGIVALGVALVVIAAVAGAILFRNSLALSVVQSAARGYGYDVDVAHLDVTLTRASARSVRIRNVAGEPVFDAREIAVGYSLRDALPGGKRLLGLVSVEVTAPHVVIIHHPNGSYNITLPQTAAGQAQAHPAPLDVRLRVTDGVVDLIDRFVQAPDERRERLSAIHADGVISPASGSYYHAGASLDVGSAHYPIIGNARFDDPRGFELQHWTAAQLPIAGLANFVLSSHAIVVQSGDIERLDLKLGGLATAAGAMQQHVGLTAELTGGRVAAPALAKPIRDARAHFVVDGDSATVRSLDARLNGIALHLKGAIYHFAAPQIRFALTARGDLADARGLSKQSATLPLGGALALDALAEGSAANPLVFARVRSPHASYGTYRLDGARGLVAISGTELDVLEAGIRYGRIDLGARGALILAQHTRTMAYATLAVPADRLPYVENIVPGMPLAALAVVDGSDAKLTARGYLGGANGTDRLDAPFDLAATGTGTVGPVVLQRRDGASVYARATLDRGANTVAALVDIHRLSLLPAPAVSLPGLVVPTLPKNVDAHLDATLTGAATGTTLSAASGALHAYGSWGDLRASADGSAARLAARGRLTSSFERLEPFTGKIGARGGIDIPFAVTNSGPGTVVQIADARFPGARVRGIALQGANATLGIGPRAIDIYSADLRVADRDVTAVGSLGNGGHVQLTAGDLDLQPARAAGLPLSGGHATVIADIGGTVAKPTATVLAALGGARYADTDVGGDVGLAYDGAALQIQRATLVYGAAYAAATGVVSGLTPGRIAPRYDVRAQLEDADIATLAHTVKNPLRYPEGTLDANLRVGGGGAAPAVSGDIRIPEGSLNGLSFRDAHVGLDAGVTAVNARDGQVTVGSTRVAFAGSAAREHQHATLRSTRVDLSDFDDYFDEAEVLAGTGHAALTVDATPQHVKASADLLLNGTRYRRFDLGNVRASVATVGSTVRVDAGLAGTNGRLGAAGSIVLAADPLRDPLRRSYLDLHTQIAGLNLGNILPAAGLEVPLLGIVDGSATVRGRYPALSLTTHAALTNGVAGRVPIDRFTLAASAAGGRGRLTDLTLIVPGATASATGTFGLRPDDAFDVRADTSSADINELIASATGQNPGVKGTLETHSRLTGTLARPQLATSVDAANVAYSGVTIPAVHVDLAGTRQALDVRNGRVTLTRGGAIGFDGHVPLGGTIALATTPISFDFTPQRVDVGAYSALLPDGSVAQGIFDGNVSVRGTVLAPRLGGQLAFTKGSFHSKTLTSPLTAIELDLAFSGTRVQIAKLHAHVAPGNIDGSGFLALRDLQDPIRGLTANVTINVAGAHLAAPKYYVGAIDGTITARKQVAGPATIGGNLTFSSARIPYTALTGGGSSGGGAAPALPDVAFGLGVNLGRDVRVQSGPVDIGATGMATLGGTLAKPTLDGSFSSTDGTVSLYRTFTVQNGSAVSFSPADGVTPSVDATATTSVADPPTDVLLRITGLSTNLHLAFSSEPSYSQQQILGLLVGAQALGAVSGVASSNGSSTGGVSIAGIGAGVLNTQLTQQFLQPFSSKLGGALGLSDLNVGYNTTGGVSAAAVRRLGKNISFTYGEQIGGPAPRTSLGVKIGSSISSAQLTFYQTAGADAFGSLTPFSLSNSLSTSPPNYTLQSIEPPTGSGFVFSYQRHFW